jgi:hypothetical protein
LQTESTGQTEISIYSGELTAKCIATESKKIQSAFPSLPKTFFDLLSERIVLNNFSDERLKAAVGYLLDNFKYPTPTIADIISFDKRVKLYSYSDVLESLDKGRIWSDFIKILRNEKIFWIKKTDQEQFNIPVKL